MTASRFTPAHIAAVTAVLAASATAQGLGAGPKPAADAPAAILRWKNGDTLPGEAVEATAETLSWKTPLFDAPLRLRWEALSRVDQPAAAETAPESFGITLRDGSYLLGELTGITAETVTVRSARHGEVALRRNEVASVQRLRGPDGLWAGPSGAAGWEPYTSPSLGRGKKATPTGPSITPPLLGVSGGGLSLPYFNRGASLNLKLPERVEIEFRLRATARPDFQLLLLADPKKSNLRLETWNDQLVLVSGDSFCPVRTLDDRERTVALRLCWNRENHRCTVFTSEGVSLAEWQPADGPANGQPGIILLNKGRDLCLEYLHVREWDGNPLEPRANAPRVELSDGRTVGGEGTIIAVSGDSLTVRPASPDQPEATYPLASVAAVHFIAEVSPAAAPAGPAVQESLSFGDGTFLIGEFASVGDGAARLKTSFTDALLTTRLEGIRLLRIKSASSPARPTADGDTVVFGGTTLHGKVAFDGGATPRWVPAGGVESVGLATGTGGELRRAVAPDPKGSASPALIYTVAGDVLPATIHAVERAGIEFDSAAVTATKLPSAAISAIQFRTRGGAAVPGFDDPAWQIVKGDDKSVKRNAGAFELAPDTSVGNPRAMQGGEVILTLKPNSYGALRLRLFCAGLDPKGSTSLIIMYSGNQVITGIENDENGTQNDNRIMHGNEPMEIRLAVTNDGVELFLDGSSVQTYPIDPAKRAGSGLILEPGSLWSNAVQPVTVSDFKGKFAPGQVPVPSINAEAKTQALTVPRFLKDDLPRQALLAGNGDVLRGEIEGTTRTHLAFRTGLENLNVPIDRVEAAVWLRQPAGQPPPGPAREGASRFLDQTVTRTLKLKGVRLANVTDFLAQHIGGLVIEPLPSEVDRQADFLFGGRSLSQTLDQVCAAFGLTYWMDAGHHVTFLAAGGDKKDLGQQSYWLDNNPFEGFTDAREALIQKGVGFPEGASVSWQEGLRFLTMNNTSLNHRRFMDLIKSGWSSLVDPPSHWLTLVSGGRLGLKVERFGPDTVEGKHPLYGMCRVPVADVYAVSMAVPPPSAAMRAMGDWQLVSAPEPVIPDGGGENSPLLGREGKTFKLSLLGGGEFDLSRERGKVIILDFWATWCGPCIQSLPGTMNAAAGFPANRVKLIAVNQSEPDERVKQFLQRQDWKLTVAMDPGAQVGRDYGAEAIPHMVVVGPDGKVAWVGTGVSSESEEELVAAVKKLIGTDG